MRKHVALLILLLCCFACKEQPTQIVKKRGLVTENAMVVTARKEASQIGLSLIHI